MYYSIKQWSAWMYMLIQRCTASPWIRSNADVSKDLQHIALCHHSGIKHIPCLAHGRAYNITSIWIADCKRALELPFSSTVFYDNEKGAYEDSVKTNTQNSDCWWPKCRIATSSEPCLIGLQLFLLFLLFILIWFCCINRHKQITFV